MLHFCVGEYPFMVFVTTLLSFLVAVLVYMRARTKQIRPLPCAAFGASITAVLSLTLWPSGGSGLTQCTVNRDLAEPFLTDQELLNIALFMPVGIFGVLATRHPVAVALGAPLLSLTIEVVQAAGPLVSRGCDSSDLEMNTAGALAGVLVTSLVLRMCEIPVHPMNFRARTMMRTIGSVAAINGLVLFFFIHLVATDSTSLQFATPNKKAAAEKAIHNAFGSYYKISAVQYQRGTLYITLNRGFAQLSWPDRRQFSVFLSAPMQGVPSYYPVPGVKASPKNAEEAESIATGYAAQRYAWGVSGASVSVQPVGKNAELGWFFSWRRVRSDVLMPMRLDIQVDRTGTIRQIIARSIDDPTNLPAVKITRSRASIIASGSTPNPSGVTVADATASG